MHLRLPFTVKLTSLVVILVIATAFAVNEVYIRGSSQILVDQAIGDLEQEAEFISFPINNYIDRLKDDAQLLANFQATPRLVRALQNNGVDPQSGDTTDDLKERLGVAFSEMLQTRHYYSVIKIIGIGDQGREILEIGRLGNQVIRTPDAQLEEKQSEQFFQEAQSSGPGDILILAPSLQWAEGKPVEPHILAMRAVIPLYTSEQRLFGMVVINMDFGQILSEVAERMPNNHHLYIANSLGDYLFHPDRSRLYASDLGHDHRIQLDAPQLAAPMGNREQDHATFLPNDRAAGDILTFRKIHYDTHNKSNYLGVVIQAPYQDIINKIADVEHRGFLFSLAIAVMAVLAAVFLLRFFIRPLNRIADAVVRYRKGEKDIQLPTDSPDEIGVLAREFRTMMEQKDDEDWVKENLVQISQHILGFKNLEDFANALVGSVTAVAGAQVGVLYINNAFIDHGTQNETELLSMLGASGYKGYSSLPRNFRWGEGLVGQCAKDRHARLVSDIPDDYLRIASALGETKPKQIFLLPVLFENSLVAVIELASVSGFSELHVKFLEQLAFNAGVIINSISASMHTEELLEEARMTAEELQRSEEELKSQQEELEAFNEELEEKTKALEEQNAQIREQARELNESKEMIEIKAKELGLSSKYKSEFLANMSHELRTPLNSLLILSKGLASNEEKNLTAEQVEEANVIYNGGLDLLNLINDILDLSKVEAGKMNIVSEEVILESVVKRIEQQFEPVARESKIAFNVKIAENLSQSIRTDSQRLEQILKNLLSNAFKFTQEGSVTLDVFRPSHEMLLQRSSLDNSNAIAFSITDTGIGIDEAKFHSIFEAFQQEDGSTDRHYGGTGLGLTIARKFAHMLGGEIHIVSKKGKGSVFTLVLPEIWDPANTDAQKSAILPPARPVTEKEEGREQLTSMPKAPIEEFIADDRNCVSDKDKTLLIIEDDKVFAQMLMKTARKRGYKCLSAGDGKTGILLAAEKPVSAIILDLKLPDIDGITVLDHLKDDLRTRHIPVHIITGRDEQDTIAPLRKGAIGYLTKPISDIDDIFNKIEAFLQDSIKRVLVVEDNRKSQLAIQSLLKKTDVEIVCTGMGNAALTRLAEERFDCIILDLTLPDMSGFDWLDEAEAQTGDGELPPIIIYTAKELTEDENRRLSLYTDSIVVKGVHSSERLLDEVTLFLHSVESTLSKDQQAVIRMQHNPDKVLQGRTVLLVDDDMRNVFALSKLLKKHGMEVVIADNGQMALDKLKEEKDIELVIMDIMMPIMDGYQAMRAIRQKESWKELPIIALTARAMPEEQKRCIEAGANDYMIKPLDIDRLLTLMRVWLFKQDTIG